MIYVLGVIIFLFFWCFILTLGAVLLGKPKVIDKLKYLEEGQVIKKENKEEKEGKTSLLKLLGRGMPKLPFNKKKESDLELQLIKADIPLTINELLVIKLLFSLALSFLVYAITKQYLMLPLVFILVWLLPKFIISRRKSNRIKEFDSELSGGITIISNSLKAGYSFLQAVAVVAEETKDPFSKEFKKLLKEMSLGISEEDALKNLLIRMESEDLTLVINAILIQKDIGGNLSEILDNISETIRERQKIKNELKTLTAQGRLSGIVLILVPIFLGVVIFMFNREYMMVLFTTTIGRIMIISSLVSEILGYLMIRKIINIDM